MAIRTIDALTGQIQNASVRLKGQRGLRKRDGYIVFSELPEDEYEIVISLRGYRTEELLLKITDEPIIMDLYLIPTPVYVFPGNTAYIAMRNPDMIPNRMYYAAPLNNKGFVYFPRLRAMGIIRDTEKIEILSFQEKSPDIAELGFDTRVLPLGIGYADRDDLLFISMWGVEDDAHEAAIYDESGNKILSTKINRTEKEGDLLATRSM